MVTTASRLTDREHLPYKVDVQQPTPRHCSPSRGNSVHDRWNTHLGAFYGRRARRLLPAALLVAVITFVASATIVSPLEQKFLAKAEVATSLYVSNFLFLTQSFGYFAPESSLNPYLHTWSLSVEEQFYLLWPGLLLLSWRFGRSFLSPRKVLAALTVLTLLLCIWLTRYREPWAFYLLPSRAWEFGLGAIACLISPSGRRPGKVASIGWIALLGLLLSCAMAYDPAYFPGPDAAFATVAAAGVLICGTSRYGPQLLLNSAPFQWIGARSYSIYLWHWPIIVCALMIEPSLLLTTRVGLLALVLLCAALSYRFVEQPIRRSRWLESRPPRSLALGGALTLSGIAFAGCVGLLAIYLSQAPEQQLIDRVTKSHSVASDSGSDCLIDFTDSKPVACTFGRTDGSRTIVLFGDSHADEWSTPLAALASQEGWRLVTYLKSSCSASEIPVYNMRLHRFWPECAQWRAMAMTAIAELHPDLVVVAQFSSGYIRGPLSSLGGNAVDLDTWSQGLRRTLQALTADGSTVVVLRDSPTSGVNVRNCLARAAWHDRPSSVCDTPRSIALDDTVTLAEKDVAQAVHVSFVDLSESFCDDRTCPSIRHGTIVYRDFNHLTMAYAAEQLEPLKNNLLPILGR